MCEVHTWKKECHADRVFFICEECGLFSKTKPQEYVEEEIEEDLDEKQISSCKHEWVCLKDRCHNRGKGKYFAYKCTLCNKFQRRSA